MWEKYKSKIIFYSLCAWAVLGILIPAIIIAVNVAILTNGFLVVLFSVMIASSLFCIILVILKLIEMLNQRHIK